MKYQPVIPLVWDEVFTTSTHTSVVENAKQNLKNLLFTVQGEREDSKYGVGLRTYLFQNSDFTTLETLKNIIYAQAARYMPEIKITKLNIQQSPDNENLINIKITFIIYGIESSVEF